MSEAWRDRLIKYTLCGIFTALVVTYHVGSFENFSTMSQADRYHILCDAFTIPGLLELMLGCLFAVVGAGALDGLTYIFSVGMNRLIPGKALHKTEKFFDYVERKNKKRVKGYSFLLVVGAVTMAIALVFLYLYLQVS